MANYSYTVLVLFFLIPIASAGDTNAAYKKDPFQGINFVVMDEDAGAEANPDDPYLALGVLAEEEGAPAVANPFAGYTFEVVEDEPAVEEPANDPPPVEENQSTYDPFHDAVIVEEKVNDKLLNNIDTFELLRNTPVSVLDMGVFHLTRSFEKHSDLIFDGIRLPGEMSVFDIKTGNRITEIGYTPVITFHVSLINPKRGVRTNASSKIACEMLIKSLRINVDTYFGGLFPRAFMQIPFLDYHVNDKAHPRYKELSLNDIAGLIYLNGAVSYGDPLEKKFVRCGGLYKK